MRVCFGYVVVNVEVVGGVGRRLVMVFSGCTSCLSLMCMLLAFVVFFPCISPEMLSVCVG